MHVKTLIVNGSGDIKVLLPEGTAVVVTQYLVEVAKARIEIELKNSIDQHTTEASRALLPESVFQLAARMVRR